jgi:hypothetical protein
MTPQVREIYSAAIGPDRAAYERLCARIIKDVGYDAFRARQLEAFYEMGRAATRETYWCIALATIAFIALSIWSQMITPIGCK